MSSRSLLDGAVRAFSAELTSFVQRTSDSITALKRTLELRPQAGGEAALLLLLPLLLLRRCCDRERAARCCHPPMQCKTLRSAWRTWSSRWQT